MRPSYSSIPPWAKGVLGIAGGILAGAWIASAQMTRRRAPDPAVPPSAYGLDSEPVYFPSRDGLLLGGYWIPAARARANVVILPGQGGSLDPDLRYAPALVNRRYNVLLFDLRGHGRSQGSQVTWGCREHLDALGAIDFIRQRNDLPIGAMGFSMGAAVAIRAAAESPDIAALICDGCYADIRGAIRGWATQRGLNNRAVDLFIQLVLKITAWRLGCSLDEAAPVRWVGQVAPRPIFFIHAEQDPYVPLGEFQRLWDAAGEPKERWIVPGISHREADKIYPAAYRQRMLDFFDRHLGSARRRR